LIIPTWLNACNASLEEFSGLALVRAAFYRNV
jgi:hypothetical protein